MKNFLQYYYMANNDCAFPAKYHTFHRQFDAVTFSYILQRC
jgi:hypothetical protein